MVAWIQLFVFCARRYYRYITFENLKDLGQEALSRELDPALLCVSDDVNTAEFLRLGEQVLSRLV